MSIIQGSAHTSTGGYQIERSLRFNSADSAYLNRTPGSAGNRRTWTISCWVKRSSLGVTRVIAEGGSPDGATTRLIVRFLSTDTLSVATGTGNLFVSSAVYRDLSAWYHIVVAFDTPNATASNRYKVYVNGSQITGTDNYPSQNDDTGWNMAQTHSIGRTHIDAGNYFDGYITEFYAIDGQALTPSSFGETDAITGVWKPKAYSGTYGTNGFFLKFADNSGTTSTTLGKDSSGNGNNWTPNNFSVTAGAGNDSLVDVPTNYGTDTGAGGTVRGNYCTWNPLRNDQNAVLSNGNLDLSTAGSTSRYGTYTTLGVSAGKWYWEITAGSLSTDGYNIGIASASKSATSPLGSDTESYIYLSSGDKRTNATTATYGATYTASDVIGVALDLDAGTLVFYKNNASQGTAYSSIPSNTWFPTVADDATGSTTGSSFVANFGQRAFAYTAPSGFKALCTQNLPTPAVVQGDDYFNTVLYTGNATTPRAITGYGFGPEFIVQSRRDAGYGLMYLDIVRGTSKRLTSASDAVEDTYNLVSSFDSDGFTMNVSDQGSNASGGTYVAWGWKAGGTGVSNTAGSISSTVSASTTAGFSVVTYTGTGANATVGHGLGVAPSMIIIKGRNTAYDWRVYHTSVGNTSAVFLNTTSASFSNSTYWNNTSPTSTVFSLGTNAGMNESAKTYVAYCFAPVAGYSAFGSYTGNGSTDGPFVYTGFRPRWIMIKRTDSTGNWQIQDTARTPYNWTCAALFADLTSAEVTGEAEATYGRDYLSNGFKIRASHTSHNASGGTYVYMAFAENPFKHSLAR